MIILEKRERLEMSLVRQDIIRDLMNHVLSLLMNIIAVRFLHRLLWEQTSGGPPEGGAGGGVGHSRALLSTVQQPPGDVQAADV